MPISFAESQQEIAALVKHFRTNLNLYRAPGYKEVTRDDEGGDQDCGREAKPSEAQCLRGLTCLVRDLQPSRPAETKKRA